MGSSIDISSPRGFSDPRRLSSSALKQRERELEIAVERFQPVPRHYIRCVSMPRVAFARGGVSHVPTRLLAHSNIVEDHGWANAHALERASIFRRRYFCADPRARISVPAVASPAGERDPITRVRIRAPPRASRDRRVTGRSRT